MAKDDRVIHRDSKIVALLELVDHLPQTIHLVVDEVPRREWEVDTLVAKDLGSKCGRREFFKVA